MDDVRLSARVIEAPVEIRRVARFAFPVYEVVSGGARIAGLGRDSYMNIYFDRGRKVVLADGTVWRIKGVTSRRLIVPFIMAPTGAVAYAGPLGGRRSYGLTGPDYGFALVPMDRIGLRRPSRWSIRRHEIDVAEIRRRTLRPLEPLPLSAVLLAFTVMVHGIPGETELG